MVNYLAILVVAIIAWIIGMLWYSPALFGTRWMKLTGISQSDMKKAKKKGMGGKMLTAFIMLLITAWVFEIVLEVLEASTFGAGAFVGVFAWLWSATGRHGT